MLNFWGKYYLGNFLPHYSEVQSLDQVYTEGIKRVSACVDQPVQARGSQLGRNHAAAGPPARGSAATQGRSPGARKPPARAGLRIAAARGLDSDFSPCSGRAPPSSTRKAVPRAARAYLVTLLCRAKVRTEQPCGSRRQKSVRPELRTAAGEPAARRRCPGPAASSGPAASISGPQTTGTPGHRPGSSARQPGLEPPAGNTASG